MIQGIGMVTSISAARANSGGRLGRLWLFFLLCIIVTLVGVIRERYHPHQYPGNGGKEGKAGFMIELHFAAFLSLSVPLRGRDRKSVV